MLNEQQIIDLLTKNELSANELKQLRSELDQNPELKKLVGVLDALQYLAQESHFDISTLSKYVLFVNGESDDEIKLIAPKIEEHIKSCARCIKELEFLKEEFNEVEDFLSENVSSPKVESKTDNQEVGLLLWKRYNSFRYSFTAVVSVAAFFILMFVVSELITPSYVKVTENFDYSNFTTSRGRNSENYVKAVNELAEENYSEAIKSFNADIRNNPNDATIFYTYYILGITQLQDAQNNILGLFENYDNAKLDEAERSFIQVLKHNTSEVFENVNNNTYFFLGQVYLLKEDFTQAKSFLNKAIENNSEYASEAKELLNSIG